MQHRPVPHHRQLLGPARTTKRDGERLYRRSRRCLRDERHAEEIAHWCESRVALDLPVNIHLTGCHHSCAQHYIGDIGLLACKVQTSDAGDTVEGYHIHVGGGFGPDATIAPEIYHDVKAEDAPRVVGRMLKAYLAHRASPQESFFAFTRRHEIDALRALADSEAAE